MAEQNCLFCKIVAGEIPAQVIYEDEQTFAFRDIKPQAPVHVLIIPRVHVASLSEAAERGERELLGDVMAAATRVAEQEGLKESGYRAVINTGTGGGQEVFHLHVHILGGRTFTWPPG